MKKTTSRRKQTPPVTGKMSSSRKCLPLLSKKKNNRPPKTSLPNSAFEKETHESGAQRSKDANRTSYGLICPTALRLVAARYRLGRNVYGPYNWCLGLSIEDTINHVENHLAIAKLGGDQEGPPEVHLSAAVWGIFAIMHYITGCKHDIALQELEEKGKLNWRQQQQNKGK